MTAAVVLTLLVDRKKEELVAELVHLDPPVDPRLEGACPL